METRPFSPPLLGPGNEAMVLPTFRQRNKSLNSRKLPGRFSYGLGTRLPHSQALVQGRRKEPGIHCLCTLSSPGDSENLCILYRITILSHHPLIAIVRARMEVLSQGFNTACIDTAEFLHLQAKSHWKPLGDIGSYSGKLHIVAPVQ